MLTFHIIFFASGGISWYHVMFSFSERKVYDRNVRTLWVLGEKLAFSTKVFK